MFHVLWPYPLGPLTPNVMSSTTLSMSAGPRLTYVESCRRFQELGRLPAGEIPPLPPRMPLPDDPDPSRLSFFRELVTDESFDGLTIPRTFIGRTEFRNTSFRNTDLSESYVCWNDFIDVDFTGAVLANSDLRASLYTNVSFAGADLRGADLRGLALRHCNFEDASMEGARLTDFQRLFTKRFSPDQKAVIRWEWSSGPVPPGG